ncbi:unnamed protein product [Ilex paraguariensis]|uniref:RNase H type-1 domain-containing protein n=1 Tax=Ilex paraguariensis TaxID=185542 RepID=A0ABC8TLN4_9AQUA
MVAHLYGEIVTCNEGIIKNLTTNYSFMDLLGGLNFILQYGLVDYQTIIESDSQVLVQMVLGKAEVPCRLKAIMEIGLLFGTLNVQIKHVIREANGIADLLASFAVQLGWSADFSVSGVFPTVGRILLQWDQSLLPSARVQKIVSRGTLPL